MRTSIDIPDDLFRQAKIAAARDGVTLRELIVDGLRDRIGPSPDEDQKNWESIFGTLRNDPEVVSQINRTIEGEFSQIDPEDWK